jgi:2Fe-2S ferredoxin
MHYVVTTQDGAEHSLQAVPGDTVMLVTRGAGLDMLGECNGSMACATCHVIVDPEWASRLPPPSETETATLETVFELSDTSRLGCQIVLTDELDGLRVALPPA